MPNAITDWTLCTKNQTSSTVKMSSQIALGPKAQSVTNMPAIDTPMKTCEISTSRPAFLRRVIDSTSSTRP